jgi:uncharacterized HAD superfamily protein
MTTKQRTKITNEWLAKKEYIERDFGSLVGKTVKSVRPLNEHECELFGWDFKHEHYAMAVVFTDGTVVVPSQDPEGNGAGFLFIERES